MMKDFLILTGLVLGAVIAPILVILGIYFNILPSDLTVIFGNLFMVLAVLYVVGGYGLLMYQDLSTGRYKKDS